MARRVSKGFPDQAYLDNVRRERLNRERPVNGYDKFMGHFRDDLDRLKTVSSDVVGALEKFDDESDAELSSFEQSFAVDGSSEKSTLTSLNEQLMSTHIAVDFVVSTSSILRSSEFAMKHYIAKLYELDPIKHSGYVEALLDVGMIRTQHENRS